jgi:hypothetical protein
VVWDLASATPLTRTAGCHGLGVCALDWLPALVPGSAGRHSSIILKHPPHQKCGHHDISPIVTSRIDE